MDRESVLLFDLGGVLLENRMFDELKRLTGTDVSPAELVERWLKNPVARRFERGHCGAEEFAAAAVADLDLTMAPEEFLAAFAGWPQGLSAGAETLLADLRTRHRVGCLSNSNEVHWTEELTSPFDFAFSSHLIGHVKPDREAFEHVLHALDVEADQVHFFDDAESNVAAARALRLNAHHTPGFERLRAALQRLGFSS